MKGFPGWLYNAEGGRLIHSQDELDALEGDWYESPIDVPAPEVVAADMLSLAARAEAVGLTVDKRWSEKRLTAEVEKAEAAKAATS